MNRAPTEEISVGSALGSSRNLALAGLAVLATAAAIRLSRNGGAPRRAARRNCDSSPARTTRAARQLNAAAATLGLSVLVDSALEHYRGGFHNPAMLVGPAAAAATVVVAGSRARAPRAAAQRDDRVFIGAALVGIAGFAFHLYNVSRQVGGWRWVNVLHKAPVGAPMALNLAGLLGLAASRVAHTPQPTEPRLLGVPAGRLLALGISSALLGTAAEAALLHFRGAFQSRYMYLPVTLPPLAALALTSAAMRSSQPAARVARLLLHVTALLGIVGAGFHLRGVGRRMGGWRNWSQNIQQGPPLPAPPSFTGLAAAGLAALDLIRRPERT